MVVVLKTHNLQLQNFFHYDVDLLVISIDYVVGPGYPLRFGELRPSLDLPFQYVTWGFGEIFGANR